MSRKGALANSNSWGALLTFSIVFPGSIWPTMWRTFRQIWIIGKVMARMDRWMLFGVARVMTGPPFPIFLWWGMGCVIGWLMLVRLGSIFLADVSKGFLCFQQWKEEKIAHNQLEFPNAVGENVFLCLTVGIFFWWRRKTKIKFNQDVSLGKWLGSIVWQWRHTPFTFQYKQLFLVEAEICFGWMQIF